MGIKIEKTAKREPNGRLSRRRKEKSRRFLDGLDKAEREMISVGTEARIRVYGVKAELSRDQLAGSAVGRLVLGGMLTNIQADAAFLYEQDCRAHSIAIESPRQPGAVDLNRVQGVNNGENVPFKLLAMKRHDDAKKAVQELQNVLGLKSNLFSALYECVLMDRMPVTENMMGSLREALNCLVKHYGLDGRTTRKAA